MAVEIISIGLVVNYRQLQYALIVPSTILARADGAIDGSTTPVARRVTKKKPAESDTILPGNFARTDIGLGGSTYWGLISVKPAPAIAAASACSRFSTTS